MKKIIPFLLLFRSLSYAESMKFVTVLSSPVGTFNKLETVNLQKPAEGTTVNFCTKLGKGGTVELRGTTAAQLTNVQLSNGTVLGRSGDGKYSLNNITLHQGGNLIGGQLLGCNLTVTQGATGSAGNIYGDTLTVAGAKTVGLNVGDGKSVMPVKDRAVQAVPMVWSNEYQQDDACKSGSSYENCKKQYLLKEKGGSIPSADPCAGESARTYWNGSSCVCPTAGRPTPVGYLADYDVCCYLDGPKTEPCWKKVPTTTCSAYKWKRSESKNFSVSCGPVSGYGDRRCWLHTNNNQNESCKDLTGLVLLYEHSATHYCNHETENAGQPCETSNIPCIDGNSTNDDLCSTSIPTSGGTVFYSILRCEADCKTEDAWKPQWF